MSKLEELIDELCPNGVEYRTINSISERIVSGGTPKTSNRLYYGGEIPWLRTQEINFCDIYETSIYITEKGFQNSSVKWIPENCVIVAMYGATVGKVAINKIPLTTNQACCNIQLDSEIASYKYVFYCLSSQYEYIKSLGQGSQTNINSQIVKNLKIPVPPRPIQDEIVRILDNFTKLTDELIAELTTELTAREKQYEYYRDKMLACDKKIPMVKLKDIATDIYRGTGIKRDQVTSDGIPCVRYGEIYTTYNIWFDKCVSHTQIEYVSAPKYFEHGDILFAITGESIEDIAKSVAYVGNERCLAGGDIVVMKHKQNPKYLAYVLSTYEARWQKSKGRIKSKVVHSNVPSIENIEVPLPSLEVQERFVNVLDNFDSVCSELKIGLHDEIELRKKQYEFYRDALLTFAETGNIIAQTDRQTDRRDKCN